MTPISTKPDVAPRDGSRHTHEPISPRRLKGRLRTLRARIEHRDAVIEAVRDANATLDPKKVADWLVRQAHDWIPAPCWAVVATTSTASVASWPTRADAEPRPVALGRGQLGDAQWQPSSSPRTSRTTAGRANGALGTALAFPLVCRHRTVGALVGLDPSRHRSAPSLGPQSC